MNILITGASNGLGAELAKRYKKEGHTLFLISKSQPTLGDYNYICDVADFEKLRGLIRDITTQHTIDMVIANAGISYPHSNDFMDFESFKHTIDVNFISIHALLEHILPQMKHNRKGHIVLISSLASIVASPTSLAYSSSKRAINSYAQSLRVQLKPFNIAVTNIQPGFIKSNMTDKNRFKMPFLMSLEKGVDHIQYAIDKRKKEYAYPFVFATFIKCIALLPNNLQDLILSKLLKNPQAT
ncbi:MAG: SDR family NAD(P)-dependent oxidoreductase [Epsilonproteobacteria bacterium]|nr:SDR family NAD(P)-dependent oxidoreductase [Campylobacterota bacterium]